MAMTALTQPWWWDSCNGYITNTGTSMNAAGESSALIGRVYFPAQTGTKTISAAGGGAVLWNSAGTITFADAGTTMRLGLQDVAATGFEDGTFDVSADLVGGTDTIANNTLYNVPMESGTKTVTYGQEIAIVMTMVSRGGTDQVTIDRSSTAIGAAIGYPYCTHLGARSNVIPMFLLKFDDNTYGWIDGGALLWNTTAAMSTATFNSGTTPDEYGVVFRVPVPMRLLGFGFVLGSVATTDTFELIYYTDPLGTPVAVETLTPDPDALITGEPQTYLLGTPRDLAVSTDYGVAVRATSANNITFGYQDNTTGFDVLKNALMTPSLKMVSRTDQTGAFAEVQAYYLPRVVLVFGGFSDGAASGGSGGSYTFLG